VDGNHRLQPTLHYFEQLLQKRTPESFLFSTTFIGAGKWNKPGA
jgi:hypothetical protein